MHRFRLSSRSMTRRQRIVRWLFISTSMTTHPADANYGTLPFAERFPPLLFMAFDREDFRKDSSLCLRIILHRLLYALSGRERPIVTDRWHNIRQQPVSRLEAAGTQTCFTMANTCINRYCSTDNEANYEKRFSTASAIGSTCTARRPRWLDAREFDSENGATEAIAAMSEDVGEGPDASYRIVSCEPGMQYLEAHIYDSGMWNNAF